MLKARRIISWEKQVFLIGFYKQLRKYKRLMFTMEDRNGGNRKGAYVNIQANADPIANSNTMSTK